jgi:hypothetical protein
MLGSRFGWAKMTHKKKNGSEKSMFFTVLDDFFGGWRPPVA